MLPPGPPRWKGLSYLSRWMRNPLPVMEETAERYGPTFTLPLPGLPTAVVSSDPELLREAFAEPGDALYAGEANAVLRPFLGEHSLLLLDGARHRRERKLVMPPFHGERMEAYGQAMLDAAHDCIDALPSGYHFSVLEQMQHVTLSVIVRTIFGVEEASRVMQFEGLLRAPLELATWPPLLLPPLQRDLGPWSPWGRFLRARREADEALYRELATRRATGTAGRTDIVSLLLDARDEQGQPMSDAELHDELLTLLVAGHETTATGLAWATDLLLEHPEVAAKLREELRGAEGPGGALLPARVAKSEYLDAVVRETLRVRPVVPAVARLLKRPLRLGAWDLPKGALLVLGIYLASRRPDVFEDPHRFWPERFLHKRYNHVEWFPFGGGVRRCVGMAFALFEMKMVLAALAQRVEFGRAPGSPVRTVRRSVTLGPDNGVRVLLRQRSPRPRAAAQA